MRTKSSLKPQDLLEHKYTSISPHINTSQHFISKEQPIVISHKTLNNENVHKFLQGQRFATFNRPQKRVSERNSLQNPKAKLA